MKNKLKEWNSLASSSRMILTGKHEFCRSILALLPATERHVEVGLGSHEVIDMIKC